MKNKTLLSVDTVFQMQCRNGVKGLKTKSAVYGFFLGIGIGISFGSRLFGILFSVIMAIVLILNLCLYKNKCRNAVEKGRLSGMKIGDDYVQSYEFGETDVHSFIDLRGETVAEYLIPYTALYAVNIYADALYLSSGPGRAMPVAAAGMTEGSFDQLVSFLRDKVANQPPELACKIVDKRKVKS